MRKKQISRHPLRKIVDEMTPKKSQTYNKTKAVTILFCQTEKTKQHNNLLGELIYEHIKSTLS